MTDKDTAYKTKLAAKLFEIGRLYQNGIYFGYKGKNIEQNLDFALNLFFKAANLGNDQAVKRYITLKIRIDHPEIFKDEFYSVKESCGDLCKSFFDDEYIKFYKQYVFKTDLEKRAHELFSEGMAYVYGRFGELHAEKNVNIAALRLKDAAFMGHTEAKDKFCFLSVWLQNPDLRNPDDPFSAKDDESAPAFSRLWLNELKLFKLNEEETKC